MREINLNRESESRVCYESLETWAREKMQGWLQDILEQEVTDFLGGRQKSERRGHGLKVDAPQGSRNGHGKPRRLGMMNGTVTIKRPRVRDVEERFESRILPLFKRQSKEVRNLIPSPIIR